MSQERWGWSEWGWDSRKLSREGRITVAAQILGIDVTVAFAKLRRVTPKEHPALEQERKAQAKADAEAKKAEASSS